MADIGSQSVLSLLLREPPLQTLSHPLFEARQISVKVLRLDLMHPHLGGNKWFKLRRNLEVIKTAGMPRVVSFGGAYSNHLRALAAAGRELGLATLGFVRGEQARRLNPVLAFARDCGMELRYLSRSDYRRRDEAAFIAQLTADLGPVYVLPEGGSNALGVSGCEIIPSYLRWESVSSPRWLMLACGTGATAAGIIRGLRREGQQQVRVRGVSVLKAPGYLQRQVAAWLADETRTGEAAGESEVGVEIEGEGRSKSCAVSSDWQILDDYHCGGYARASAELIDTLAAFTAATGLPLEPVYTGKLILALLDQVKKGVLPAGSEVILVHTGGLLPLTPATHDPD